MTISDPGAIADVAPLGPIAVDWGNAMRDRVVHHFASAVARDAAITAPTEGMACWLADTDQFLVYNGAAWRLPWSNPWGRVASAVTSSSDQGSVTAITDVTALTCTWTAVANRRYKIYALAYFSNTGAGNFTELSVTDASNVQKDIGRVAASSAASTKGDVIMCQYEETGITAGSVTRKCRTQAITGTSTVRNSFSLGKMIVEDIGPNGAAA